MAPKDPTGPTDPSGRTGTSTVTSTVTSTGTSTGGGTGTGAGNDPAALLALFDRRLRRDAVDDTPGNRIERIGHVVRQTGPDWNGILWSELDETTADAAIAAEAAHFAALGVAAEWKLYSHDRPADLGDRLLAAGFVPEDEETLMVAAVAELPLGAVLPEGVRLTDVTDPEGVASMDRVHRAAFGHSSDGMREQLLRQLGQDTTVMTLALAGDVPVCAARMDLHPGTGFASLWGGGTHPDWRGRGIYRALVAHRARTAAARGYHWLQVDAGAQSRPILERLGFRALATTTPYLRPAPPAGGLPA
ncbi:GNAT family N-acetyltransferase [Streptomyces qinzhouensis]|uniref:GNAT family N-acetyltransferase n=1 Tax=Streptomyces qinzhouensis TaxID=2599401 RepID=A0A5B8JNE2_9ACTN|nr:GNAT family N-acetyltransferase [Streptomyces qinzhouensis]QDY79163.1 GNAT family N-acetyltransferase [Streptomyces qinzhouensis]